MLDPSRFFNALAAIESGNQNIFSKVDPDVAGPGSRSQGYFQINTPTWQDFAPKAGVSLSSYPNAMSAPREVQQQVASVIPFSRFGPRTQTMMAQQFGPLNKKATIGNLAGSAIPGTTLTSTPITNDPSIAAHSSPQPAPYVPTFMENVRKGDISAALTQLATGEKDKEGEEKPGTSPLNKLVGLAGSAQKRAEQMPAPSAQMLPAQDMTPSIAPIAQQLLAQTFAASARPLNWSTLPYGSGLAGPQVPGMTLNSLGAM